MGTRCALFLLAALVVIDGAKADLTLLSGTSSASVVYLDGASVVYRRCDGGHAELNRKTCKTAGEPFAVPSGKYVTRLAMLHKVHSTFSDPDGLTRVSRRIELVTRDMARVSGEEAKAAAELLKQLTSVQRALLTVKSEILDFLVEGSDAVLDGNYRAAYRKAIDAFAPLWYDDLQFVWTIGNGEQTAYQQKEACTGPWSVAPPYSSWNIVGPNRLTLQEAIGRTEVGAAAGDRWVWLGGTVSVHRLGQAGSGDVRNLGASFMLVNGGGGKYPVVCVQ